MLKLALCANCGKAYDEAETDDAYCTECPGDYDPDLLKLIDEIKNDKQQED